MRCGVPNRTRPWNCRRQVTAPPCWQHRSGGYAAASSGWTAAAGPAVTAAAAGFDALVVGVNAALATRLADRVTDYLGAREIRRLRRRRRKGGDCELLAQAARAVLRLKQRTHELVGEAASRALERAVGDLPRFHRLLVQKVAAKLPMPWDLKLEAIARGLQAIGIWSCLVQGLPLERCTCLLMRAVAAVKEQIEAEITELLDATERDLRRAA
jgi:hypothetical protein